MIAQAAEAFSAELSPERLKVGNARYAIDYCFAIKDCLPNRETLSCFNDQAELVSPIQSGP